MRRAGSTARRSAHSIRCSNITRPPYIVRALTISAHGGLEQLEFRDDLPDARARARRPTCASACARPRSIISTCSSSAGCPASRSRRRGSLGADACGVVDAVGARRARRRGRRPRASINPGISDRTCEYCLRRRAAALRALRHSRRAPAGHAGRVRRRARARTCARFPPTMPLEQAAAFTLATLTAWRMLVTRARVQPGETC